MRKKTIAWIMAAIFLCPAARLAAAAEDEGITLHESVQTGQKITCEMTYKTHEVADAADASSAKTDSTLRQYVLGTATVLNAEDGSATAMRVETSPDSYDIRQDLGAAEKKTPFAFAGKSVTIRRHDDGTITNDFSGTVDDDDLDTMNCWLSPDEDYFPDVPVKVGQTWDVSQKLLKHTDHNDGDQMAAVCRLDWVKQIGGRLVGQISCSSATIYHAEGGVEEDVTSSSTLLVDMAKGQITEADQSGKSLQITTSGGSTRTTDTLDFWFKSRILPAGNSTRP
jgi:hypothetical protein